MHEIVSLNKIICSRVVQILKKNQIIRELFILNWTEKFENNSHKRHNLAINA